MTTPHETQTAPSTLSESHTTGSEQAVIPTGVPQGDWPFWMPTGIGVVAVLLALSFLPVPAPLSADESAEVAVAYYKLKAPQAWPAFKQALKLDPGHRRANFAAGLASLDMGRPQDAEVYLKKALERSPGDQEIELSLAALYQTVGRNDEAQTLYRSLAKRFPNDARILYNQALLALKNDDKSEALQLFERYLALPHAKQKRASVERTVTALRAQLKVPSQASPPPTATR